MGRTGVEEVQRCAIGGRRTDKTWANGVGGRLLEGERHLRSRGRAQLGEAMAQRLREMRPARTGRGRVEKVKPFPWTMGRRKGKGERDQARSDSAAQRLRVFSCRLSLVAR